MLQKFDMWIPALQRSTTIHLHLPDNYYDTNERYPVMYMFDGHNLFVDGDSTFGISWGLEDFANSYGKPFLIVGLECDHRGSRRLQEYTPYALSNTFFGKSNGDGAKLADWIVNELKPHIDRSYRTWPQREATGVGGSSMGGLMAMYCVLHHNDTFSKAACLSPSFMMCVDQICDEIFYNDISPDTRVYWSFGSRELSARNRILAQRALQDFEGMLESRGGRGLVAIIEGGKHNESSWRNENQKYFDFLWMNNPE